MVSRDVNVQLIVGGHASVSEHQAFSERVYPNRCLAGQQMRPLAYWPGVVVLSQLSEHAMQSERGVFARNKHRPSPKVAAGIVTQPCERAAAARA